MRKTIACLTVAAGLIGVLASQAGATDLRGMVGALASNGLARTPIGRPGITVTLARSPGSPVANSVTNGAGLYFFTGVAPGNYVVLVSGRQYPVSVGSTPAQDIAPIIIP